MEFGSLMDSLRGRGVKRFTWKSAFIHKHLTILDSKQKSSHFLADNEKSIEHVREMAGRYQRVDSVSILILHNRSDSRDANSVL